MKLLMCFSCHCLIGTLDLSFRWNLTFQIYLKRRKNDSSLGQWVKIRWGFLSINSGIFSSASTGLNLAFSVRIIWKYFYADGKSWRQNTGHLNYLFPGSGFNFILDTYQILLFPSQIQDSSTVYKMQLILSNQSLYIVLLNY